MRTPLYITYSELKITYKTLYFIHPPYIYILIIKY